MAELILAEGAAPATPATGKVTVYAKTDGKLYSKDDAGTETPAGGMTDGDKGDITVGSSGTTLTINNGAVTNAKMADMAQSTIKGRAAGAGTGAPTDLTATQATAVLNAMVGDSGAGGTKGLVPAPAAGDAAAGKFLKADGNWTTPSAALDIAGLTALADLADADQVPVYDASAAANRKAGLLSLLGIRNRVLNGGFTGNKGTTNNTAYNDNVGTYALGWRFLGESNSSTNLYLAATAPTDASIRAAQLTTVTNNEKFALMYVLPSELAVSLRGKAVCVSSYLKVSNARIGNVKMAIVEWTGTVDATSGDPVSSWGADGTNPTLAAGWAYITESATPTNLNVTTSWAQYTKTATVGASANNLAVLIWNDDKTNNVGDSLSIGEVGLWLGSIAQPFEAVPADLVSLILSAKVICSWNPQDNEPPSASYATPDTRNGHPVLDFDDASTEYAIFTGLVNNHNTLRSSGNVYVLLVWAATSATSGNVYWGVEIELLNKSSTDLDSNNWGTLTQAAGATHGTSGKLAYTKIAASNNLFESLSKFRTRVQRTGGNGSDTMVGDAELRGVFLIEASDVEMNSDIAA